MKDYRVKETYGEREIERRRGDRTVDKSVYNVENF